MTRAAMTARVYSASRLIRRDRTGGRSNAGGFIKTVEDAWEKGLCCQCGTCSGICPTGAIRMTREASGDYRPRVDMGKCAQCGLCLNVCPGFAPEVTEGDAPTAAGDTSLGPLLSCYLAHATEEQIRGAGASGGVVSALSLYLLNSETIDAVVMAKMSNEEPLRPSAILATTPDQVLSCAQSKYLPIPVNECLRAIIEEPGTYAVVGLPCQVRGIRRAMKEIPILRERIRLCIGLFCGFHVSFPATRFWLKKLHLDEEMVASLEYRARSQMDWHRGGGGFLVRTREGEERYIPKATFSIADSIFISRRCTLCEDLTNECADLSVGDPGPLGIKESLVLCRSSHARTLLLEAHQAGYISLHEIPEEGVVLAHRGLLFYKKKSVTARFRIHKALGLAVPQRSAPLNRAGIAAYSGSLLLLGNSILCLRRGMIDFISRVPTALIAKYSRLISLMLMNDTRTLVLGAIRRLTRGIRKPFPRRQETDRGPGRYQETRGEDHDFV